MDKITVQCALVYPIETKIYAQRKCKLTDDEKRKTNYLKRHQHEDADDPYSAAFYATNLLWNKQTLQASIRDVQKRYGYSVRLD